jgi:hypothetical protein
MAQWRRHNIARGNTHLRAIHVIGFEHVLVIDDGKHIKKWRQELRTKLLIKGREIRRAAAKDITRIHGTSDENDNYTAPVARKQTVVVMTAAAPQAQSEPEQIDESTWDAIGEADFFDLDDWHCWNNEP